MYIIKQGIRIIIYVTDSRPNGWTDWAEILCGHSWVAVVCFRLEKNQFFFEIYSLRTTPGSLASYR